MHDLLETNDCGLEIGKCRGAELEAHIIEDLPDPHHDDDLTQLLLVIRSRFARRARLVRIQLPPATESLSLATLHSNQRKARPSGVICNYVVAEKATFR
jgi:hypothetical protein